MPGHGIANHREQRGRWPGRSDENSATRAQDATYFLQRGQASPERTEDPSDRERHRSCRPAVAARLHSLRASECSAGPRRLSCHRDHPGIDVGTCHGAGWPDLSGRETRDDAGPAGDIQHMLARPKPRRGNEIIGDRSTDSGHEIALVGRWAGGDGVMSWVWSRVMVLSPCRLRTRRRVDTSACAHRLNEPLPSLRGMVRSDHPGVRRGLLSARGYWPLSGCRCRSCRRCC